MSDLIERDAAVGHLREVANTFRLVGSKPNEYAVIDWCADRLSALPALPSAGEWKPASEPPKIGARVLVYCAFTIGEPEINIATYDATDAWPWETDDGNGYSPLVVTHWQPLPEPPK